MQDAKRNAGAGLALYFCRTDLMPVNGFHRVTTVATLTGLFQFSMDLQPTGAQNWHGLVKLNGSIS